MPLDFWPFNFARKEVTVADLPAEILQLGASKSGQSVTVGNALKVATVLACVRVISEGIAQVPFTLYQANGRERLPARAHPLYDILRVRPNAITTSFSWRETIAIHAALTGNGFAFINRDIFGNVGELINIEPGYVTINRAETLTQPPTYTIRGKGGSERTFPAESIFHLSGPSWDGVSGMEVVKLAREAIGLTMATEEAHARLHSNGAKPGGLLSVEGTLKDDQFKSLRKWIDDNYTGSANAWKTMILDRSAKFINTAMTGVDAQHIETRRLQIEEICRIFRVMPIMVCSQDKSSTFAGAEQNFLAHVVHTLQPWYERIEQAVDVQLLSDKERAAGYYSKLEESGLLRGALKDTAEYIYKLVGIGVLTRNEGREMLDKNPLPGMDEPLTPINLTADMTAHTSANEQTAKAIASLETKLDAIANKPSASQPLHVSFNQEPIEVRNEFAAPVEQKAGEPVVIENHIHVPEGPAPIVKNEINVPESPPANITLEATLPAVNLVAQLPARKTHTENVIERDAKGNIVRSYSDAIETDANA